MKGLAYIASPSKGNRALIPLVADEIHKARPDIIIYSPVAGFYTPEQILGNEGKLREVIMKHCLGVVRDSEFVVALLDAPTEGVYTELVVAWNNKIPIIGIIDYAIDGAFLKLGCKGALANPVSIRNLGEWVKVKIPK